MQVWTDPTWLVDWLWVGAGTYRSTDVRCTQEWASRRFYDVCLWNENWNNLKYQNAKSKSLKSEGCTLDVLATRSHRERHIQFMKYRNSQTQSKIRDKNDNFVRIARTSSARWSVINKDNFRGILTASFHWNCLGEKPIKIKVSNFLLSKTTVFVLYLKLTVWNLRNRPTVVVAW